MHMTFNVLDHYARTRFEATAITDYTADDNSVHLRTAIVTT
jgi:hypothetical protein